MTARNRLAVLPLAAALLAVGLTPATSVGTSSAAPKAAARVIPGQEQTWEVGVVRRVVDGDTVVVDITTAVAPGLIAPPLPTVPGARAPQSFCSERSAPGGVMPADGRLDGCRVRLIGIQAPETPGAAGSNTRAHLEQCGATAAKQTLAQQLPVGTRVQLRSISPASVERQYSGGRLTRTVYYQDRSGRWVDAARAVFQRGQAMWFPFNPRDPEKPEHAHNLEYRRLVDAAASARQGLFWPNACGRSQANALRVWAVSDPAGDDANKEHVILLNGATQPLDVSGWVVRDSSLTYATMPAGTVIAPGDYLRIWSGRGTAGRPTARDFYFNGSPHMFPNADPSGATFTGDGVYVFDRQPGVATGNLRAWFHYPCDPRACRDPLVGQLRFGPVHYNPQGRDRAGGEFMIIQNAGAAAVRLGGYALIHRGMQFPFAPTATLAPGAALKVMVGPGLDAPGITHLGLSHGLLANKGDRVTLAHLNGRMVDCRAWGSQSCRGLPVSGALERPTTRPAAPAAPGVSATGRRLTVWWATPIANGSPAASAYRARILKKVGKRWRSKGSCTATAPTLSCQSRKLGKGTYRVSVRARNVHGYGASSAFTTVRLRG